MTVTMRAFYATHKQIRVFILGTPEGWHVAVFDLQRRRWAHLEDGTQPTLKEAKIHAQENAERIAGSRVPELKWF
jgi:hypothetical protein